jgi:hypothetical protein
MSGRETSGIPRRHLHDALFPDGEEPARRALERLQARVTDVQQGGGKAPGRKPPERTGPVLDRKPGKGDHGHPDDDDLDRHCRKLLRELEKRCPGLLPTGPLPDGEVADTIVVDQKDVEQLFSTALGVDNRRRKKPVIWEQAGSELLVHLHRVRVAVLDGLILIGIPVETVETGRAEVTVAFAVGTPDRLAGMVATTEAKPRGPAAIVDLWAEALTAFAWQTLLDVVERLAARTGVDLDGEPLLPGALVADKGRLGLIPQAAHVFEGGRG